MPGTHTNRKGVTYVLGRTSTPTGRTRYVFAREPQGEPVEALPAGYTIRESVNGVVSLARERPARFSAAEVAAVEAAVRRHRRASEYRVAALPDAILVYERLGPGAEELLRDLGMAGLGRDRLGGREAAASIREILERHAQYAPVLRFRLVDADRRIFGAARRRYLAGRDEWLVLGQTGPIAELARQVVPRLGTEAFLDLR
jgi:hypothetical protein